MIVQGCGVAVQDCQFVFFSSDDGRKMEPVKCKVLKFMKCRMNSAVQNGWVHRSIA